RAGVMGGDIAETIAAAGLTVHILKQFPGKAEASKQELAKRLDSRVSRGKLDSDTAAGVLDLITPVDALGDLAEANLVIEAVVEDIGVKRELIAALEKCLPPEAIIATNTSSLSVTAIAGKAQNPQRIAGFHFFNPVPLMRVVEVIKAALTDARVLDVLKELAVRV
ncbi:3-hydroxyacyl-CoA dehydrogenase NAD-binding domain-containing protein, partial [Cellulomonas iranensis]|uniref:3-hydroxyacyl-CoA dehydrogenase NAD-binding domain-containing protein n=1 Tax=Cellulomonas iranensis TaxID=76862 RepID=UPI00211B44A0